jgi:hypothetical protein
MSTNQAIRLVCLAVALLFGVISTHGQTSFEVTPLVGGIFEGSLKVQQPGQAESRPELDHSFAFGAAAGLRFDTGECASCDVIEFRWMRQKTTLDLGAIAPNPSLSHPNITIDHFVADFTHEWPLQSAHDVRPFLTVSLGAANLSTPVESGIRFQFGVGGGVKIFLKPRLGIRIQAEYMPMVITTEGQKVVCAQVCVATVSGGLMSQFAVTAGPIFRF